MEAPGGGERVRTDDLRLAKPALSQLSYTPVQKTVIRYQSSETVPGPADGARRRYSGSDDCLLITDNWWVREDLNLRPHAYQARALTS